MLKHTTIHVGLTVLLLAGGTGAALADVSAAGGNGRAPAGQRDAIAAQNDRAYEKYRCVVLGDDAACHAPKVSASRYRLVPGDYAAHLMENGMDQTQALAEARAFGEEPTWRLTAAEPPQEALSDSQLDAREKCLSVSSESAPSTALGQAQ